MRWPTAFLVVTGGALMASAAAAAPAPSPDPEADTELIVGSKLALDAWRRDGSGKRVISAGAAPHPRWLDGGSVVVLRSKDENLAKGAWLEQIALSDGKRTKLVALPPFACASAGPDAGVDDVPYRELDLQNEFDFAIDRVGRRALLTIMDRNLNMADVMLDLRIDLTTGKVERWLNTAGDDVSCAAPSGVKVGKHPAWIKPPKARRLVPSSAFPFAFQKEALVDASTQAKVLRVPGYRRESTSPSGRWELLGGDVEEGDYIHRSLVLLDRTTGDLFPVSPQPGPWPPALLRPAIAAGEAAPKLNLPVANTISAVGETDTRWLGASTASELLIIDDLVIRPGAASFSVNGRLAR